MNTAAVDCPNSSENYHHDLEEPAAFAGETTSSPSKVSIASSLEDLTTDEEEILEMEAKAYRLKKKLGNSNSPLVTNLPTPDTSTLSHWSDLEDLSPTMPTPTTAPEPPMAQEEKLRKFLKKHIATSATTTSTST